MSTPCGIFWDIENIDIPRKSSADSVVNLIYGNIIERFDLSVKEFFVAGNYNTVSRENVYQLKNRGVTFIEVVPGRNAADKLIISRMVEFIRKYNRLCTLILITGDSDLGKPLKQFLPSSTLKIYFIYRDPQTFQLDLKSMADHVFQLTHNSLEEVQEVIYHDSFPPDWDSVDFSAEFTRKYFVSVSCDQYFTVKLINLIRDDLSCYGGSYAVITESDDIWCSFDDIAAARSALDLKGSYKMNSVHYTISVKIETPPKYVRNLMMCAKLNGQAIQERTSTRKMPQFEVTRNSDRESGNPFNDLLESAHNISQTINTVQSIYSTITSQANRQPNRGSNTGSNDGCRQS